MPLIRSPSLSRCRTSLDEIDSVGQDSATSTFAALGASAGQASPGLKSRTIRAITTIVGFAASGDHELARLAARFLPLVIGDEEREDAARQALAVLASELPDSAPLLLSFLRGLTTPPACLLELVTAAAPVLIADDSSAGRLVLESRRLLSEDAAQLWVAMLVAGVGPATLGELCFALLPLIATGKFQVMPIVIAARSMPPDVAEQCHDAMFRSLFACAKEAIPKADEATVMELIAMAADFASNKWAGRPVLDFLNALPPAYAGAIIAAGFGSMWEELIETGVDLKLRSERQMVCSAIALALKVGVRVRGLSHSADSRAIGEFVTALAK